ncbi:RES family NAD+ phosphorylase [Rhodococcus sp. OK302]|uniref:RES family NAD+ phosphorylase n=1 Tax=Rhodococcus sp. OK302 TaxID=1882769 RepID=UPI000B940AA9|nr:RES family NAD+ phosphorylase [Rhodococcus sp. OK302]OYD70193.1 RES domain-containing protein [Rhodococcus sp. OK302]
MVKSLSSPQRPLSAGGVLWQWIPPSSDPGESWQWCRVYHRSSHTPDGATFRSFGPVSRFDHHTPNPPALDPDGRAVLYVADNLATAASEVFGEAGVAQICPNYRVSIVEPATSLDMLDLAGPGSAMAIGALPALAQGAEPRASTQEWARAIFEDRPAGDSVSGIHYRTAYGDGDALALWDCSSSVKIRRDAAGNNLDHRLQHPSLLRRLQVEMWRRRIQVDTIPESACASCH